MNMQKIDELEKEINNDPTKVMRLMPKHDLSIEELFKFSRMLALEIYIGKGRYANASDAEVKPFIDQAFKQFMSILNRQAKTFRIPQGLDHKYRGCGNGIAVIEKNTNKVIDFDYTDSKLRVLSEQNISMSKAAGKVIKEDDQTITYRANFSSYTVCLF